MNAKVILKYINVINVSPNAYISPTVLCKLMQELAQARLCCIWLSTQKLQLMIFIQITYAGLIFFQFRVVYQSHNH